MGLSVKDPISKRVTPQGCSQAIPSKPKAKIMDGIYFICRECKGRAFQMDGELASMDGFKVKVMAQGICSLCNLTKRRTISPLAILSDAAVCFLKQQIHSLSCPAPAIACSTPHSLMIPNLLPMVQSGAQQHAVLSIISNPFFSKCIFLAMLIGRMLHS